VKYAESKPELKVMVGFSRRCTLRLPTARWATFVKGIDDQSTSHTKQLINGLHRVKRVESTLSILLLVICMMRLGFSFSTARLVGGYSLIVVSPSNLILFSQFYTSPSFHTYLPLISCQISPFSHFFLSPTIPNTTILKDHVPS
jgi:hypothetical protein